MSKASLQDTRSMYKINSSLYTSSDQLEFEIKNTI